jgi:hypothetical protein
MRQIIGRKRSDREGAAALLPDAISPRQATAAWSGSYGTATPPTGKL